MTTATPPPATTVPPVTQPPTTGGGGTPATTPGPAAGARPNVSTTSSDGATSPWLVAVLVVLALVLLAGGYVAAIVVAWRRGGPRRRDAADPVAAVSGAWEEALDRLREAHVAPDPALTPLELARVAPQHTTEEAEPPLRRLASAYTVTRYGESTPAPDDVRLAWCTVDELERALTADVGWRERWRRRLDPATLPRSGRR